MKVAVIGAGTMAQVHSAAYLNMPQIQLVGIVDHHEGRGQKLADERNTTYYPSLQALFDTEQVDVVDVCVPTPVHKEYVLKAAYAKKHVICEKPMARNLEDAREMIDVCKQEGVRFFVAHVVRFFPEYVLAQQRISANDIGEVGTVRARRGGSFPLATEDWYASFEKSGGLIVDLMIHDFDYLRGVFGEVDRVYAKSLLGREVNRIDHALVSLRFKNGVIAHVEGTWAEPSGFSTQFEFAGTSGIITHDSREEVVIKSAFRETSEHAEGVNVPESPVNKSPYQLELEHFLSCIETGAQSRVTPEDGYLALEISLAALESVKSGSVVFLGGNDK